jgi:hypothetical protein
MYPTEMQLRIQYLTVHLFFTGRKLTKRLHRLGTSLKVINLSVSHQMQRALRNGLWRMPRIRQHRPAHLSNDQERRKRT